MCSPALICAFPGPFPYAPTIAMLYAPFTGPPYPQAGILWLVVDLALVVAILSLLAWYAWRRRDRALLLGAGLWLLLPATADTVYLGNINLVMALLITLAYISFGSPLALVEALSGFAIGVVASIKPYPLGLAILSPSGAALVVPGRDGGGVARSGVCGAGALWAAGVWSIYGDAAPVLRQLGSTGGQHLAKPVGHGAGAEAGLRR